MSFYTTKGDDGTTGLFYGGRVRKDDAAPEAYGAVDEAQAAIGMARAFAERGGELDLTLLGIQRDLYVLMAELATLPANRHKLSAGASLVTPEMVDGLSASTDDLCLRFAMPSEFVLPGEDPTSAALDFARAVVRRAERRALAVADRDSHVIPYLNRLSSLLWAAARWVEGGAVPAKRTQEQ